MAYNGVEPIDYTSDIGRVRVLISDTYVFPEDQEYLFADDAITAILDVTGGGLYRAAASLLRAMAISEAIIAKVIRNDEISTDGAKTAEALRKLAYDYDNRADAEDALDAESFDLIDPFPDDCWHPEAIYGWHRPWA